MMIRIKSEKYLFRWSTLRCYCLIILLHLAPLALSESFGQSKSVPVAQDDRSSVQVRYPEREHLRDLQTDHDYQYGNDAPPPQNPFSRLLQWLFQEFNRFLRGSAYQNVGQYVLLAAIAGLVIYLLMKAEVLRFLFPKKAKSVGLDYENLSENIHEINFQSAIEEAINQRNFRLAIRLLYLQTLKGLADASKITYQPEKTNRQYVYELAKSPIQFNFEQLTRQFEFVWYGNFPVDESRFLEIQNQFRQFNTLPSTNSVNAVS